MSFIGQIKAIFLIMMFCLGLATVIDFVLRKMVWLYERFIKAKQGEQ